MNNKAKRRKSIKSTIVYVGKAKVMSYGDIVKVREERAVKEAATAGKGKRGRKRESAAPEAGAPEPKAKVARTSEASEPAEAPVARMSEPERAPVMRMSEAQLLRKMRIIALFFSSDRFLEAGSRGLRDLLLQ
ncbi:hypothetical protein V8E54_007716 [Elaphomyces granulatus]